MNCPHLCGLSPGTLCDPVDCSPPGPSVHRVSQERKLDWLPFPPPADLPGPGMEPTSLECPALAGWFFTTEPPGTAHEQHSRGQQMEPACPWERAQSSSPRENSECQGWRGWKGDTWGGELPAADGVTQVWGTGTWECPVGEEHRVKESLKRRRPSPRSNASEPGNVRASPDTQAEVFSASRSFLSTFAERRWTSSTGPA